MGFGIRKSVFLEFCFLLLLGIRDSKWCDSGFGIRDSGFASGFAIRDSEFLRILFFATLGDSGFARDSGFVGYSLFHSLVQV